MHRTIKRFGMEGTVADDSLFAQVRERHEALVIRELRGMGYAPILGLGPFWATEYNKDKDYYDFVLSVYAIYVGRKKAWQLEGISVEGKEILLSTALSKSNPSLSESE